MGVDQRTGAGSNPRKPCVVSKSDSDHGIGYYGHTTLGLKPTGTICHSTHSLGHYPILNRKALAQGFYGRSTHSCGHYLIWKQHRGIRGLEPTPVHRSTPIKVSRS